MRNTEVDQLAKQAAEIAVRLATLPAEGVHNDAALDSLELLAVRVLREISAARTGKIQPIGETCGMWPAAQPLRR
jgi:hypothetical protein